MDQADDELRVTIQHIWPLQAKKMLDLLIPRNNCLNSGKLTVGKIYAGLLILESWRNTRFGQIDSGLPVSLLLRVLVTYLTAPLNIYMYIYSPSHFRKYILPTCCVLSNWSQYPSQYFINGRNQSQIRKTKSYFIPFYKFAIMIVRNRPFIDVNYSVNHQYNLSFLSTEFSLRYQLIPNHSVANTH